MRPFAERPVEPTEPTLIYCQDCDSWWWTDTGHACDADGAGEGIVLAALAGLVLYVLALVVWDLSFGWPL